MLVASDQPISGACPVPWVQLSAWPIVLSYGSKPTYGPETTLLRRSYRARTHNVTKPLKASLAVSGLLSPQRDWPAKLRKSARPHSFRSQALTAR